MYLKITKQTGIPPRYADKLLLLMKLTTIILIGTLMQVSAASFGQRMSMHKSSASLKEVFGEIKIQTGYNVVWDAEQLADAKRVSANFRNMELMLVLQSVMKGQPLDYTISDNTIVIKKKEPFFLDKIINNFNAIDVQGTVVDEHGNPLAGVTIRLSSSGSIQRKYISTTVSRADGTFTIRDGNPTNFLIFAFIGYETQIVKIGDRQQFSINMQLSKNPLDEIKIIAYGTTTARLATGSISSIKSSDIEKQPVSNPILALAGRMPGVLVSQASGVAGGAVTLQIRGQNTIGAGKNPLYIVDGVPFSSTAIEANSGPFASNIITGSNGFSPLDNIPPSEIESIEVLKDADATSIYGSRAANGVVVITTRKGKAGEMKINVNAYSGVGTIDTRLEMLDAEQYLDLRRQAFTNDNITPTSSNAPDLLAFGSDNNDYLKLMLGNTSRFTDVTSAVSGGSKLIQYLINANYRYQSSTFPDQFADRRGSLRFNIQSKSENDRFSLALSGGYTKNVNNLPGVLLASVYGLPPNLPIYNNDGSLYWNNSYTNPYGALLQTIDGTTDNLIANSTINYRLAKGLSFKTDLGFNHINVTLNKLNYLSSLNPNTNTTGVAYYQNNYNQVYTIEPQLNYLHQLGPGKLDVLAGGTFQNTKLVQPFFTAGTFTNDLLAKNLGAITPVITSSGFIQNKYVSAFTRINYNIGGKYIINLSGRRDGSSRFASGKKFGNFGSIGTAWIFTEEGFAQSLKSWLSFGKIRASYGTIGNDQIPDYGYLATYSTSPLFPAYNGTNVLVPARLANSNYSWEVTKKLEFSLDLNFFQDRLSLNSTFYRNRSNNLLVGIPVAAQTGFLSYQGNLPALIQNRGFEFSIDAKTVVKNSFSWSTNINLSIPKNTLLEYPGIERSTYANTYVVGQSLNIVQGYHLTGFDNGIAQFEDVDGSGNLNVGSYTTTGKGDYLVAGNSDPVYFGGLNNSLKYKQFNLDFLFQFVKQKALNIYSYSNIPGSAFNVPEDVLNLPFNYTTLTASPAATSFNRYKLSDAAFSDASFIRLKNISLSYNFQNTIVKRWGLTNLNIYARAQNLLTFTNYLGFDPETQRTGIPPMKMITLGLQTSL